MKQLEDVKFMEQPVFAHCFKPGEVAILKFDRVLSARQREHIRSLWVAGMPDVKCLVLDATVAIGVLSVEDQQAT